MKEILIIALGPALRYFVFAGLTYLVVWKLLAPRLQDRRTSTRPLTDNQVAHEIRWSLSSILIFTAIGFGTHALSQVGIAQIYLDVDRYGVAYIIASTVGLILFHDMYFYFTHRALHHPKLFRFHKTHHRSVNPSPWAAFSFHPVEAVINALVLPIASIIAPLHPIAIGLFLLYTMALNIMGHIGHELFPKNFVRSVFFKLQNSATHHAMHHRLYNWNFGLYFNWWDRWLGTNHAQYAQEFAQNTTRAKLEPCGPSTGSSEKNSSPSSPPSLASTGLPTRTAASSM